MPRGPARYKLIRKRVIERDGSFCSYCKKELTPESVTVDHIVPESKNGGYSFTNLIVACSSCNSARGNKPFFEYCLNFKFSPQQLMRYKKMTIAYQNITILNLAKEEFLVDDFAIPKVLIKRACEKLKIKKINPSFFEEKIQNEMKFNDPVDRRKIKFVFERLIRDLEAECFS